MSFVRKQKMLERTLDRRNDLISIDEFEKILTNELTNKEFLNFTRDFLFKNKEIYPDW